MASRTAPTADERKLIERIASGGWSRAELVDLLRPTGLACADEAELAERFGAELAAGEARATLTPVQAMLRRVKAGDLDALGAFLRDGAAGRRRTL